MQQLLNHHLPVIRYVKTAEIPSTSNMMNTFKHRKLSVTVVGDGMAGKTSLIDAFLGKKFTDKYTATSSDVYHGTATRYGEKFNFKIFDFAGEREPEFINSSALQESDVIIVCYSTDDRESYESIRSFWAPQMQNLKRKQNVMVVGLQSDKRNSNISSDFISQEEGRSLMQNFRSGRFYECSAKHGTNIQEVWAALVDSALKCRKKKINFIKRAFGR